MPDSTLSMTSVPSFAIGSDVWPGLAKLAEECGELQQVVGKLMAYPDSPHPDGSDLPARLSEELADLLAAIRYVRAHNVMQRGIDSRERMKFQRFQTWDGEERSRLGS